MALALDKEPIIDPILEKIDPTPNIHELFLNFNRRFFWGKLDMVEVAWSGRQMTSCAGICSFHPKTGHCIIKLSAPLLSLRPRKDMVETLLHEMIHAYLFVTKNYKDRNDHGPEFHKHMYRINKETGTNISVYHTFNDEVRSFQRHVWRCNGPCQKTSPFFGLVRRASNRAPGPNDTWWMSHKMKCSGEFEKIEEPPGYKSKKKGQKPGSTKNGIRNFFPPATPSGTKINTLTDISSPKSKPPSLMGNGSLLTFGGNPSRSNIHTLTDSNPPKFSSIGKTGGAASTNKNGTAANAPYWFGSSAPKNNSANNTGGKLTNRGTSTVLETGRPTYEKSKPSATFLPKQLTPQTSSQSTPSKSKPSATLVPKQPKPSQSRNVTSVQEQMRNIWGNKFADKRKQPVSEDDKNKKIIVECDDCSILLAEDELALHRSNCSKIRQHPCPVCNRAVREGDLESHLSECLSDSITEDLFAGGDNSDGDESNVSDNVDCPVCGSSVLVTDINSHIDECLTLVALKDDF